MKTRTDLRLILAVAILAGSLSSCPRRPAKPDQGGGRPLAPKVMACLGAIRAYHRQADLRMAMDRRADAESAIQRIIGLRCASLPHAEVREAILDAQGRLARLVLGRGALDEAEGIIDRALGRRGPDSFFRANLHMVRGDILDARARQAEARGKKPRATALRHQAIAAFERAAAMNERLLGQLLK